MSIPLEETGRRVDSTARRFFSAGAPLQRPGLTALRALAAFLVVAFHLNHFVAPRRLVVAGLDLTPFVTIGWLGVNIFFVLSGFLITQHLLERFARASLRETWGPYLRDRILRVVPAYWAQIAVLFAIAVAAVGSAPAWTRYVPAHLVFLENFSFPGHNAINDVYWSLPVEFSFYLVAPLAVLLAWPASRHRGAILRRAAIVAVAGIVVTAAWRAFALAYAGKGPGELFWFFAMHLPGCADQFALGMAAAFAFAAAGLPDATLDRAWARRSDLLVLAGLGGIVAAMYLMDARFMDYWRATPLFFAWSSAQGVATCLLVAGVAARGPLARALFENAPILWLGTISYSVYLWHPFLIAQVAKAIGADAHGLAYLAAYALPAIVAVSAASYYMVERPFLRMKRGAGVVPREVK